MTSRKQLISDKLVPECDLKTHFILRAHFHCLPRRAAGSGAVKGKGGYKHIQALWSDGQQEGSPLRCYWNYERLFIFPLRRGLGEKKRWRGTLQGCPLKNVCQAFIATVNIYSNSGIPWMWFSSCCLELWGTDYWRQTGDIWELNRWSFVQTVTPEHPLLSSSAVSFSLFLYLKHSHMAAPICSRHVKTKKKTSWSGTSAVHVWVRR